MKIAAIRRARESGVVDAPDPTIGGGYALVKVEVAPMCNEYIAYRDEVYLERNRPDSLGHELAGEVVAAPPGSIVRPGDRVVALCGFPCGSCDPCRRGYYAHCAATDDVRGVTGSPSGECGFAQYALKRDWMLVPIPDSMSYEHASMACCGLGPTFGAFERMGVGAGGTVLVTGLGPVGLGGVINAKARGATVIGVARQRYRAELALALGCDVVVDPETENARARIAELTGGRGPDQAVECSGQQRYQRLLVDSIGRLGSVAFCAEPGVLAVHIDDDLVQKGVTLLGSLDINLNDARRLLTLIAGIPDVIDRYITHRFPMDAIGEAFETQLGGRCGKVLLYPWAGATHTGLMSASRAATR